MFGLVKEFKVGDAVFGLMPGGAYAEVRKILCVSSDFF
jgi:NADPH:quinone reductase-like Zn-dependent oxidoreductase